MAKLRKLKPISARQPRVESTWTKRELQSRSLSSSKVKTHVHMMFRTKAGHWYCSKSGCKTAPKKPGKDAIFSSDRNHAVVM